MGSVPYGEWHKETSPTGIGVDIYFATKSFYCMELTSGENWCCGQFDPYESGSCKEDIYSDDEKSILAKRDLLIDNKNHLLFTPKKPEKPIDIYFVYSGFFEGSVQTIYLLSEKGDVWRFTDFFPGMYALIIIFAGILGGLTGFFHSLCHLIKHKKIAMK